MARTFIKRCQCCDATFTAKNHTAKWCSSRCGMRAYQRRRRGAPEADPAWWHATESARRVVSRSALVQPEIMEDPDELPLAWREPAPAGLAPFNYAGRQVRVITDEQGEPWFVAADVCAVLGITTEQTRRLDDDEKGLRSMQTPGGTQSMTTVNEFGLYSLILGSRKPEARAFKRWVTHEVLPSIRKTGQYAAPGASPQPPKQLTLQGLDDQHPIKVIAASEAEALNIWHHAIFKAMQQGLAAAFAPYSGRVHSKVTRAGFEFVPNGKELPFVSYLPPN